MYSSATPKLYVVGWKQLIIPHVVALDSHESCRMVCFGIAIPAFSRKYPAFFYVFMKLLRISFQKLVLTTLLNCFPMADSHEQNQQDPVSRLGEHFQDSFKILRIILRIRLNLHLAPCKVLIHFLKQ